MQLGFSKLVSENLINDFLSMIILNLKEEKKLKLSGFGTFSIRKKSLELAEILKLKKVKLYPQECYSFQTIKRILKNLFIY